MFQNLFLKSLVLRNSLKRQNNVIKKKSMIVIDRKLNIMDLKLKYIPFKERYETVDFVPRKTFYRVQRAESALTNFRIPSVSYEKQYETRDF